MSENFDIYRRLVADFADDAFVVTDATGRIEWINDAFTSMTGYSLEDIRGSKPGAFLQGVDTSVDSVSTMSSAIASGEPCAVDVTNYTKSGQEYIAAIKIVPIKGPDGTIERFVSVQRDITADARQRDKLLDHKAFQDALDQQAIVSVADRTGRISYVNSQFCDISGFSQDELIGQNHRILNSGENPKGFFADMWQQLAKGSVWHGEICNRAKDGSLYWVDTTIVPVRGHDDRIIRYVSIRYDITARKQDQANIHALVFEDSLTGLANRRSFLNHLEALAGQQRQENVQETLLCCVLDVDDLRAVNEQYGTIAGDTVLIEIARRLSAELRAPCLAARMAADDFAFSFLASGQGDDLAFDLDSLHERLAEPIKAGDTYIQPSLTLGASRFAEAFRSSESAMMNADSALFHAKQSGGNMISLFDPVMRQQRVRRSKVKEILNAAIRDQAFTVALQPILNIQSGELHAFEALARLSHNGMQIAPSEFIPIAESSGMMQAIGHQLLTVALDSYAHLCLVANFQGRLGINIAPAQLRDKRLANTFLSALNTRDISPSQITIELTETALLDDNSDCVLRNLSKLQEEGIRVALDDFGTGFSSISHLRKFDVEKVKIDRSFITNLHKSRQDQDLVRGLIDLCHSLKIAVVAEGVEAPAHLELLKTFGCDLSQGYWHAKPMPLDQTVAYVRSFASKACVA